MSRIRLAAVLIAAMAASASAQDQQATPAESLREAWIGRLNMGGVEPVMQFRIMDVATGEPVVYFDSITEGRSGFRGIWSRRDTTLNFEIPPIKLTFTGTLNETGDVATGTWRQGGREIPLTLEKRAAGYRHVWANRPQRPQPPFPYETRDVRFENAADAVTLAGTLTLPAGDGPHPAVVLISGSGPQDRDE